MIKTLRKYGPPKDVSVVYEAGPTGYGLHRALSELGYHCEIIAPSLIPHRAGERIKTDRRDCVRLAELSRAGELKAIWVPDEAHEALRNLWRAREDALGQRLRARQQLKSFLMRMDRRFTGKTSWTRAHHHWLADQRFNHAAEQIALTEYLLAEQLAGERVVRLTTALQQATQDWRFGGVVAALRALRGIDTVSAIGLVCEIGDIGRFASARQLMGYLGLVPSERSNGTSVRRGSITKTGNSHARRLLTEAAWNYRFPAHMSKELQARSEALAPDIRTHAWKAQLRLCSRFAHLKGRKVHSNKACVDVHPSKEDDVCSAKMVAKRLSRGPSAYSSPRVRHSAMRQQHLQEGSGEAHGLSDQLLNLVVRIGRGMTAMRSRGHMASLLVTGTAAVREQGHAPQLQ